MIDVEKSFKPAKILIDDQVDDIKRLKDQLFEFVTEIDNLPESREKSLCLTKLQEAQFWMCECIAKHPTMTVCGREDCEGCLYQHSKDMDRCMSMQFVKF